MTIWGSHVPSELTFTWLSEPTLTYGRAPGWETGQGQECEWRVDGWVWWGANLWRTHRYRRVIVTSSFVCFFFVGGLHQSGINHIWLHMVLLLYKIHYVFTLCCNKPTATFITAIKVIVRTLEHRHTVSPVTWVWTFPELLHFFHFFLFNPRWIRTGYIAWSYNKERLHDSEYWALHMEHRTTHPLSYWIWGGPPSAAYLGPIFTMPQDKQQGLKTYFLGWKTKTKLKWISLPIFTQAVGGVSELGLLLEPRSPHVTHGTRCVR